MVRFPDAFGKSVDEFVENKAGALGDDLALLNQFKKLHEVMVMRYAAAFKALAASPISTFTDVAEDPVVRKICGNNGIDVLGGPMPGSVPSEGVSVWVRTARPAKVEFRLVGEDGTIIYQM